MDIKEYREELRNDWCRRRYQRIDAIEKSIKELYDEKAKIEGELAKRHNVSVFYSEGSGEEYYIFN